MGLEVCLFVKVRQLMGVTLKPDHRLVSWAVRSRHIVLQGPAPAVKDGL